MRPLRGAADDLDQLRADALLGEVGQLPGPSPSAAAATTAFPHVAFADEDLSSGHIRLDLQVAMPVGAGLAEDLSLQGEPGDEAGVAESRLSSGVLVDQATPAVGPETLDDGLHGGADFGLARLGERRPEALESVDVAGRSVVRGSVPGGQGSHDRVEDGERIAASAGIGWGGLDRPVGARVGCG